MYSARIGLDWLTITKKYPMEYWERDLGGAVSSLVVAIAVMKELGIEDCVLTEHVGVAAYRYAWKDTQSNMVVFVSERIDTQGVMVHVPGTYTEVPMAWETLLAVALDHEWKVTRIDVAADFMNTGIKPDFLHFLYSSYHPRAPRNSTLIVGKGGSTFYLGSRTSDRMLRIYDKGAEQQTEEDWLRVEGEYKGELAMKVAREVLLDVRRIAEDFRRTIDLPMCSLSVLLEMLNETALDRMTGKKKTEPNRVIWLNTQVYAAVLKLAHEDYEAACDFRDRLIALLEDPGVF